MLPYQTWSHNMSAYQWLSDIQNLMILCTKILRKWSQKATPILLFSPKARLSREISIVVLDEQIGRPIFWNTNKDMFGTLTCPRRCTSCPIVRGLGCHHTSALLHKQSGQLVDCPHLCPLSSGRYKPIIVLHSDHRAVIQLVCFSSVTATPFLGSTIPTCLQKYKKHFNKMKSDM